MSYALDRPRPLLPGEEMPPPALSHGENSPTLPFIVATYKGIQRGWEPVKAFADREHADRFSALIKRIRPDYVTRTLTL